MDFQELPENDSFRIFVEFSSTFCSIKTSIWFQIWFYFGPCFRFNFDPILFQFMYFFDLILHFFIFGSYTILKSEKFLLSKSLTFTKSYFQELLTEIRVNFALLCRKLSDSVDYMVRRTRAMSENRFADPYYQSLSCSGLSFMPMALRASRANTPIREPTPLR